MFHWKSPLRFRCSHLSEEMLETGFFDPSTLILESCYRERQDEREHQRFKTMWDLPRSAENISRRN